MSWYVGDLFLLFIFVFCLDFKWCFGNKYCEECYGFCFGYYFKVGELWEYVFSGGEV